MEKGQPNQHKHDRQEYLHFVFFYSVLRSNLPYKVCAEPVGVEEKIVLPEIILSEKPKVRETAIAVLGCTKLKIKYN